MRDDAAPDRRRPPRALPARCSPGPPVRARRGQKDTWEGRRSGASDGDTTRGICTRAGATLTRLGLPYRIEDMADGALVVHTRIRTSPHGPSQTLADPRGRAGAPDNSTT
jgi:hypothetical protein